MRKFLILAVILGFVVAFAPAAEARTYCGKVTTRYSYGTYQHKTYLIRGKLSCKSVRTVLKASIPLDRHAKGWSCIKRDQPVYDVTCTKGSVKVGAITEL